MTGSRLEIIFIITKSLEMEKSGGLWKKYNSFPPEWTEAVSDQSFYFFMQDGCRYRKAKFYTKLEMLWILAFGYSY